jgi:hypothetical protein
MKYFHLLYVENVWMIFAQFQLPNCGMGSLWLIGKVGPRPINHKLNILQFSNEKISTIIRIFHALISCIENTFERYICWKMSNLSDIHSFIGSYFIHQHIYLCVKRVFNAWTYEWTNFTQFSLLIFCILNLWLYHLAMWHLCLYNICHMAPRFKAMSCVTYIMKSHVFQNHIITLQLEFQNK